MIILKILFIILNLIWITRQFFDLIDRANDYIACDDEIEDKIFLMMIFTFILSINAFVVVLYRFF